MQQPTHSPDCSNPSWAITTSTCDTCSSERKPWAKIRFAVCLSQNRRRAAPPTSTAGHTSSVRQAAEQSSSPIQSRMFDQRRIPDPIRVVSVVVIGNHDEAILLGTAASLARVVNDAVGAAILEAAPDDVVRLHH